MPIPQRQQENEYRQLMELSKADPIAAGNMLLSRLQKAPKTKHVRDTINQLTAILSGDEMAWQYSSKNITDAMQFIITNVFMKSIGLSAKLGEDAVNIVLNVLIEDIHNQPFTSSQLRFKAIAESYGFTVYRIS